MAIEALSDPSGNVSGHALFLVTSGLCAQTDTRDRFESGPRLRPGRTTCTPRSTAPRFDLLEYCGRGAIGEKRSDHRQDEQCAADIAAGGRCDMLNDDCQFARGQRGFSCFASPRRDHAPDYYTYDENERSKTGGLLAGIRSTQRITPMRTRRIADVPSLPGDH
jgi:hypothetical protein